MRKILCINKPKDWTSFDVVNKLSKIYKTKVGHTGTLDPQATGVLVCLLGATKVLPYLDMSTKKYRATCQLGIKTNTGDIWGEVIEKSDHNIVDKEVLEKVILQLVGPLRQEVPMTSAKKVKGKKLYEYQRQNIEVETQYQDVVVHSLKLLSVSETSFEFEALVSSGTYIRSLCETIATQMNQIGTMSSLVRTQCGKFTLEDCSELDDIDESKLLEIEVGLDHFPSYEVDDPNPIYHGKPLNLEHSQNQILVMYQNQALAIYQYDEDKKEYRSQRGLWI